MKPNVKMIDKSKNSFIYFQLGIIAVMVSVLFVLEFNFKTVVSNQTASNSNRLPEEEVFSYNPRLKDVDVKPKQVATTKPVLKVASPKFIDQFKKSTKEINDDVVNDILKQNVNPIDVVDANKNEIPTDNIAGTESEEEVFVVVEFLPRFPNCASVSKADQKACFDEQLKKEIFKNLKYPERDLENKKEGTVFVQFIVDEKGNFTAIKSAENNRATDEMRKAVESAVKKLPKIIPAKQGARDVKVTYTIPISFKIGK